MVDDLEVASSGKFFEFDQGKIRLNAGSIAVHQKPYGSGGSNCADLGVAVTVFRPQFQGAIPGSAGRFQKFRRTAGGVQSLGNRVQALIFGDGGVIGRAAVVADDTEHIVRVFAITGKVSQRGGHAGGLCVGFARQYCRKGRGNSAAFG